MIFKKSNPTLFLSKNLNYLLEQYSIDLKNLSLETGIPAPTLSRLRKDGINPTISSIEPLLEFFRVDINTILYEDMSSQQYSNRKKIGNLVSISVYTIEEITAKSNPTVKMFIGTAGVSEESFGISINSDILVPAFQANSIIILDPTLTVREGDYVFCRLGHEEGVKPVFRQIFFDGDDAYFKPINPGFGEMRLYQNYEVIGVVIKSIESYR